MSTKLPRLDVQYVEKQRKQLNELRDELRKSAQSAESEEGVVNNESTLQPREFEDDAQKLDLLEREGLLVGRDVERLARVERALKKIDEGTYGLSDVSGQPIPKDRLDVLPDAINTLNEQAASERS
jgi:DnaK suppressor protein